MKIKADFKQGDKITEIPAGWFNAVASFVNNLIGVNNIAVKRPHGPVTESSPVEIEFVGQAGGAELSDGTPTKDGTTGAAGTAATASRSDHKHPLNVPSSGTPEAIADAGALGDDDNYARGDHVHADKRASSDFILRDLNVGSTLSPDVFGVSTTNGWNVANHTTGVKVRMVTRVRYNETDSPLAIYYYYRTMTFDPCGRLLEVSSEGRVSVHIPVAVTIG